MFHHATTTALQDLERENLQNSEEFLGFLHLLQDLAKEFQNFAESCGIQQRFT